jgi:TolB protein
MIMNADCSAVRPLTTNNYADEYPAVAPDGKTVLYSTNKEGAWKLYMMNIDGSGQHSLGMASTSNDPNDPCKADWSPDGKQIVFPMTTNGKRVLHTANRDGSELKAIPNGDGLYPHWSRDGKLIAFFSKGNVFTIHPDGEGRLQLTKNDPMTKSDSAKTIAIYPQWSVDNKSIYFIQGDDNSKEIFRMNADGSGEKKLTAIPGRKWYLRLSPDDQHLVYTTVEEKVDRLYVLKTNGDGLTLIGK